MASVDCRLIAPQSPFRTLIVEPVQEGVYATRQGSQLLYGIFQKSVLSRTFPDFCFCFRKLSRSIKSGC